MQPIPIRHRAGYDDMQRCRSKKKTSTTMETTCTTTASQGRGNPYEKSNKHSTLKRQVQTAQEIACKAMDTHTHNALNSHMKRHDGNHRGYQS